MEQHLNEVNNLETIQTKFTVRHPESIREKVAAWAFGDADDAAGVITRLERIDCAGCHSPAPIFYHDMAREISNHWPEIDAALDGYRDATGEPWTPRNGQNFLTYLWFAYEWTAGELADDIRRDIEASEKED